MYDWMKVSSLPGQKRTPFSPVSFCGKTNEAVFVTVMNLLSVTAVALQAVVAVGSGDDLYVAG